MLPQSDSLLSIFQRWKPTPTTQRRCLEDARADLGLGEEYALSPVCVAYALLKLRAEPEEVSRLLSWQEFEKLAGALLRAAGFTVSENVVLTRPRAQIDVVARGTSAILSIDCKHYRREQGPSSLRRVAQAQLKRSSLLRAKSQDKLPIVTVILSMSEPEGKFEEGVAVVPIRTLRSFLSTLDSYYDLLDLR